MQIDKQQLAAQILALASTHVPHSPEDAINCSLCDIKRQIIDVEPVMQLLVGICNQIIKLVGKTTRDSDIDEIVVAGLLDAFKLGMYLANCMHEVNEIEKLGLK